MEIVAGETMSPQNNKIDEAKTFIRELLSEGPVDSAEAVKKAEEAGIKRGSLYKAKNWPGSRVCKMAPDGCGWVLSRRAFL